jgi:hypothetical protein
MFCLFDGSSEGIAEFLISVRISEKRQLKPSVRLLPVIQGFWLENVRTVNVGVMSSMHLLMNPVTEVIYSSMQLDKSLNIFQSVLAKQSCSVASASSDHFLY